MDRTPTFEPFTFGPPPVRCPCHERLRTHAMLRALGETVLREDEASEMEKAYSVVVVCQCGDRYLLLPRTLN